MSKVNEIGEGFYEYKFNGDEKCTGCGCELSMGNILIKFYHGELSLLCPDCQEKEMDNIGRELKEMLDEMQFKEYCKVCGCELTTDNIGDKIDCDKVKGYMCRECTKLSFIMRRKWVELEREKGGNKRKEL